MPNSRHFDVGQYVKSQLSASCLILPLILSRNRFSGVLHTAAMERLNQEQLLASQAGLCSGGLGH
jgi:hypothetical protein